MRRWIWIVVALASFFANEASALDPNLALSQYALQQWHVADGMPQNMAISVSETPDGFVWFGTEHGLVRFDGEHFVTLTRRGHPALTTSIVRSTFVDQDGSVWFGTNEGVVCQVFGRTIRECLGREAGLPAAFVRRILRDEGGVLWVGTDNGLHRLDEHHFVRVSEARVWDLAPAANGVWVAAQDGLWRATPQGMTRAAEEATPYFAVARAENDAVVAAGENFVRVLREGAPPVTFDAGVGSVSALAWDAQGHLWVGGSLGLARCRDNRCVSLSEPHLVVALHVASDGSLWVGASFDGLFRFTDPAIVSVGATEGLPSGPTTSVIEAADHSLYVATARQGVYQFVLEGPTARVLAHYEDADGSVLDKTFGVALDGDGTLWISTMHGFVFVADGLAHRATQANGDAVDGLCRVFERYRDGRVLGWLDRQGLVLLGHGQVQLIGIPAGSNIENARAALANEDGSVWVASANEIVRLDGEPDAWRVVERVPVSHGTSFLPDRELGLLVGTVSHGALAYDSHRSRSFGTAEGLPDDTLYWMVNDRDQQFWSVNNRGFVSISRESVVDYVRGERPTVDATLFGAQDGLRAGECNGGKIVHRASGETIAPTFDGVAYVSAATMRAGHPREAVLDSMSIDNRVVEGSDLRIPPGSHRVLIRFALPAFSHRADVVVQTRIAGLSEGWQRLGESLEISLERVPAGDYSLEATTLYRGQVVGDGVRASIHSEPPWTETWWAKSLTVLLALLTITLIVVFRTRAVEAQKRVLEQTVTERTASLNRALEDLKLAQAEIVRVERDASIATLVQGVAHELNNPINFLSANVQPLRTYAQHLAQVAQTLSDGRARTEQEITKLTNLTPRKDLAFVLQDLEAIVKDVDEGARRAKIIVADLQNLKSTANRELITVDVGRAIEQTLRLLAPRIGPKHSVEKHIAAVPAIAARAGQFEQVMVNLIDNALRAMPSGGVLTVSVERLHEETTVRVTDTGVGMDEETLKRCTDPFFTTREAGQGTGLGLALVSSMVEAMGAHLHIESVVGRGTTVTISFGG